MLPAFGQKAQLHPGDTGVILGGGTILYVSAYLPRQYGFFVGGEVDLRGLIAERISLGELPEEVGGARTRAGRILVAHRTPMPSRSTSTSEVPR